MKKLDEKLSRYIAGGLFGVALVWSLIRASTGAFNFWTVLDFVATALMLAAMFTEKYALMTAGAGLMLPDCVYAVFMNAKTLFALTRQCIDWGINRWDIAGIGYSLAWALSNILALVGYILLMLAVFKRSKAKKLCFASAGLQVGSFVATMIGYAIMSIVYSSPFIGPALRIVPSMLFACAPIVLAGFAMQMDIETSEPKEKASPAVPTTIDSTEIIDKLMKLKELLDIGAITQEEFDAKKKQLLGL